MNKDELIILKEEYELTLKNNILPFWINNSLDKKNGGYYTGLDRKGEIIETDKSIWFQGRFSWILSKYYTMFEQNPSYLSHAKLGIDFLEKHGFDNDGHMFFRVQDDGAPLIKRIRYFFSETFFIIALASYAKATGDTAYVKRFKEMLALVRQYQKDGSLTPKFNQNTRSSKGFALPMIMMSVLQECREADPENEGEYNTEIDKCLDEMKLFLYEDKKAVLEQISHDGKFEDHFEGRQLNPGHAIEGAWFVMHEGIKRNDESIKSLGIKMFDWMWEWGWDKEHGGIIYFQDVLGKPKTDYWHDMKFWWPQNEAAIGSLYAYAITKDEKYFEKHKMVMEWSKKFMDDTHGEWYGYLHRDGRVSTDLKGNMYKGPFHIPRMYMRCAEIIDFIIKN